MLESPLRKQTVEVSGLDFLKLDKHILGWEKLESRKLGSLIPCQWNENKPVIRTNGDTKFVLLSSLVACEQPMS